MTPTDQNKDNDLKKGAMEDEAPGEKAMTTLSGQLGHRDQDPLLKSNDSDFPEPGESPEHQGQIKERNRKDQDTRFAGGRDPERRGVGAEKKPSVEGGGAEGGPDQPSREPEIKEPMNQEPVNQEPGESQKKNQGGKKDDDLAA
jgi:hypothetical protein